MVFVSATSPDKDPPPLAAIDPGDIYNTRAFWDDDEVARTINGLTVFAHVSFSGCRARSPSELKAEVEHAGQRYTFVSGMAAGCGGVWSVGDDAFLELISGLRPAG